MRISENVHMIRKYFQVTPTVKRYINLYLIVGKSCYLIDAGVAGTEALVEEYLKSIKREIGDIKAVFLTHSHPDHAGGAAGIKKLSDCEIYASLQEKEWIEDIHLQFAQRPIPNFYQLIPEAVRVDCSLEDGVVINLEEGIQIRALSTPGHSQGSMSYILNDRYVFTGDAIPVKDDLPIFVDYKDSIQSLEKMKGIREAEYFCPAWDDVFGKADLEEVVSAGKNILGRLQEAAVWVEKEQGAKEGKEKISEILKRADLLQYAGNPLVARSVEACITASHY